MEARLYVAQAPFWLSYWWPWASGSLANVLLAPCLWPALPPYPTRCPTTFQTSMVTQPLNRNHTPRKNTGPHSKSPLPLCSFLFSLLHQGHHLFLQQQLRRLQAAACQQRLYQGGELGLAPRLLSTQQCWLWAHTQAMGLLPSPSQSLGAGGPLCPFSLGL